MSALFFYGFISGFFDGFSIGTNFLMPSIDENNHAWDGGHQWELAGDEWSFSWNVVGLDEIIER